MLTTIALIETRLESAARLKPMRKLGTSSLVALAVRRVTDCACLSGVVVVGDEVSGELARELVPLDVPLFVSNQSDPLGRFADAVACCAADAVIRVRADHPLVDPQRIDQLVTAAREMSYGAGCDYLCYRTLDGSPETAAQVGLFSEWCRADAIVRADREAFAFADRDDVTRYIYTNPGQFNVRSLPAPAGLAAGDIRLAIELDEDWEHAQTVFEALGPEALDGAHIAKLLSQQPRLRARMAELNRSFASVDGM